MVRLGDKGRGSVGLAPVVVSQPPRYAPPLLRHVGFFARGPSGGVGPAVGLTLRVSDSPCGAYRMRE